jgi:hypothetical protein
MEIVLEKRFPQAERVELDLLTHKFSFSKQDIDEIKNKWIKVDDRNGGTYCKPGGKYDVSK